MMDAAEYLAKIDRALVASRVEGSEVDRPALVIAGAPRELIEQMVWDGPAEEHGGRVFYRGVTIHARPGPASVRCEF